MDRDPYQMILDAMGGGTEDSGGLLLGQVTTISPLKVLVGGNTMEQDELLCNAALLAGRAENIRVELTGTGTVGDASGAAALSADGTITRADGWAVGDRLVMLPIEDAQRYIILCKVVEL